MTPAPDEQGSNERAPEPRPRPANAVELGRGRNGAEAWIDPERMEWNFSRSSGPGGQNVNKVNTKAELRLLPADVQGFDDAARARFITACGKRLTREGELILTAETHRSQLENREVCIEKLRALAAEALHPPKVRRKTRVSQSQKRKRLDNKKREANKKSARRWRPE